MNPKTRAEFVVRDMVAMGTIDLQAWHVIAGIVATVIEQDRDSAPRDEDDTLP
jgi:hypothetical protein